MKAGVLVVIDRIARRARDPSMCKSQYLPTERGVTISSGQLSCTFLVFNQPCAHLCCEYFTACCFCFALVVAARRGKTCAHPQSQPEGLSASSQHLLGRRNSIACIAHLGMRTPCLQVTIKISGDVTGLNPRVRFGDYECLVESSGVQSGLTVPRRRRGSQPQSFIARANLDLHLSLSSARCFSGKGAGEPLRLSSLSSALRVCWPCHIWGRTVGPTNSADACVGVSL